MFWSYQKDGKTHKVHYKGAFKITVFLLILFFIIFIAFVLCIRQ